MQIGSTFIAYPQAAELVQPGDGALDHPACDAGMTAMPGTTFADLRAHATLPQDTAIAFTVVAAVGLNDFRPLQWVAAPSGNGRHALQERHQLRRIVPVGASQDDIERDAVAVDEEVVLAARLAPISRVGTSFFPPCTAPATHAGAAAHFLWQHFPRQAGLQDEQYAGQDAPFVQAFAPGRRFAWRWRWQQGLDDFP